jgi:hypothetical protein
VNYLDFDKELEPNAPEKRSYHPPAPKKVEVENVKIRVEDIYDDESEAPGTNPL